MKGHIMGFKDVVNNRRAVNFFAPEQPVPEDLPLSAVWYFDETKELHPPKWRKTFEEIVVRFD